MSKELEHQVVREVVIDGLAVLKIVKHCNDNLPSMVAGSLLGLDVDGVLDITYVYPFPAPQSRSDVDAGENSVDDLDGESYQLEMMKMLQKVNVDNNCVGWYTSMYNGTMSTMDVVNYQFSYQSSEELSDNCVVVMYDPMQSVNGNLVIKAFRLSEYFVRMRKNKQNDFIKPTDILIELPVKIKNAGHVSAFIRSVKDTHADEFDLTFASLSLAGAEVYTEKTLELLAGSIDDLVTEQQRFQQYTKLSTKSRHEHIKWLNMRIHDNYERKLNGETLLSTDLRDSGLKPLPELPPRGEPLLLMGQLGAYSKMINNHVDGSFHKLLVASTLNDVSNSNLK